MPNYRTTLALACALHAANAAAADTVVDTEGGLSVQTLDGAYSFELGGRIMLDAAWYRDDHVPLHDGTEARRLRLDTEGVLAYDWEYEFGVDFADSEVDVKDAWIGYQLGTTRSLRVGQFKVPYSLEEMTSSKHITFMERALPNELVLDRRIGVGFFDHGENWTAAIGGFGQPLEDSDDQDDEGDEGWVLATRATYAPWSSERHALHLGAALNYQRPGDTETVRFRARPESHITDARLVNTDKLDDVDRIARGGLETAWVNGPWSIQGEYLWADVARDDATDLRFSGYYTYLSWFLTGESRDYQADEGEFGRIDAILSPYGAWELGLRFSHLDLQDGDVDGGSQDSITVGANWYVDRHIRFMANYIVTEADPLTAYDLPDGTAPANSDNPGMFQLRAQIDF